MESRGQKNELITTAELDGYYQIATFNAVDAMGANFINSCQRNYEFLQICFKI